MQLRDFVNARSTLTVRVRFSETDAMGVVHHAAYPLYLEMGRVEWLRERGVTYSDWANRGRHLPVVELNVRYRQPARFDDLLTLHTDLTELRSHSLRFSYTLERDGVKLVTAMTRLACIDAQGALVALDTPF